MKPTPNISITGVVSRLNVEPDGPGGGVVMVAYVDTPDGEVGPNRDQPIWSRTGNSMQKGQRK